MMDSALLEENFGKIFSTLEHHDKLINSNTKSDYCGECSALKCRFDDFEEFVKESFLEIKERVNDVVKDSADVKYELKNAIDVHSGTVDDCLRQSSSLEQKIYDLSHFLYINILNDINKLKDLVLEKKVSPSDFTSDRVEDTSSKLENKTDDFDELCKTSVLIAEALLCDDSKSEIDEVKNTFKGTSSNIDLSDLSEIRNDVDILKNLVKDISDNINRYDLDKVRGEIAELRDMFSGMSNNREFAGLDKLKEDIAGLKNMFNKTINNIECHDSKKINEKFLKTEKLFTSLSSRIKKLSQDSVNLRADTNSIKNCIRTLQSGKNSVNLVLENFKTELEAMKGSIKGPVDVSDNKDLKSDLDELKSLYKSSILGKDNLMLCYDQVRVDVNNIKTLFDERFSYLQKQNDVFHQEIEDLKNFVGNKQADFNCPSIMNDFREQLNRRIDKVERITEELIKHLHEEEDRLSITDLDVNARIIPISSFSDGCLKDVLEKKMNEAHDQGDKTERKLSRSTMRRKDSRGSDMGINTIGELEMREIKNFMNSFTIYKNKLIGDEECIKSEINDIRVFIDDKINMLEKQNDECKREIEDLKQNFYSSSSSDVETVTSADGQIKNRLDNLKDIVDNLCQQQRYNNQVILEHQDELVTLRKSIGSSEHFYNDIEARLNTSYNELKERIEEFSSELNSLHNERSFLVEDSSDHQIQMIENRLMEIEKSSQSYSHLSNDILEIKEKLRDSSRKSSALSCDDDTDERLDFLQKKIYKLEQTFNQNSNKLENISSNVCKYSDLVGKVKDLETLVLDRTKGISIINGNISEISKTLNSIKAERNSAGGEGDLHLRTLVITDKELYNKSRDFERGLNQLKEKCEDFHYLKDILDAKLTELELQSGVFGKDIHDIKVALNKVIRQNSANNKMYTSLFDEHEFIKSEINHIRESLEEKIKILERKALSSTKK